MDGMGGFEFLRDVWRDNREAVYDELDYELGLADSDRCGWGFREGIRVDLWRSLSDSPGH